jgi:acyl-CoA reductase-like NAD-dependent aldehyde dehydrogenase
MNAAIGKIAPAIATGNCVIVKPSYALPVPEKYLTMMQLLINYK